jgi:3-isopropylmalate dehydrogenase
MMLRISLGLEAEATAIEDAVRSTIADGVRTPDIAGDGGAAVSASVFGDAVAERIREAGRWPVVP